MNTRRESAASAADSPRLFTMAWNERSLCVEYAVDVLAVAFIVVRLAFVLVYLGNRSTTRTLLWNLGLLVNAAIFFVPW